MEKSIYYHHSVAVQGQPRVTVAGLVIGKLMLFGVSKCSKKDQFEKAHGRKIAVGRAKKKPIVTLELTDNEPVGKQFIKEALKLC